MKRAARFKRGSVVFDKARSTWVHLRWEDGQRRSKRLGTRQEYPTKAAAWRAVEAFDLQGGTQVADRGGLSVRELIEQYRAERMPQRKDTRRSYEVWMRNYILPRFAGCLIVDLGEPRPVELWLESLPLAPKSKAHIRGLLRNLWDFAAWSGYVPRGERNPMELVKIRGVSRRIRCSRSLTVEEFRNFAHHLTEPFRTMALLCVCLGLRISECLALRWSDVDWLNNQLQVERGIVAQQVDDVKSQESRKQLTINRELLMVLRNLKQAAQFSNADDWMFASAVQLGRLPWSYDQVWRVYQKASKSVGIGGLGTHSLRHTYRSWLDSVGTPVGVQQKLMRHTDVRTTMRYGDAFTSDMAQAHGKIVGLALNGSQTDRKPS